MFKLDLEKAEEPEIEFPTPIVSFSNKETLGLNFCVLI